MRNGGGDVSIYHDEQGTNRATFEDTLQIHQSINKRHFKKSLCLSVRPSVRGQLLLGGGLVVVVSSR